MADKMQLHFGKKIIVVHNSFFERAWKNVSHLIIDDSWIIFLVIILSTLVSSAFFGHVSYGSFLFFSILVIIFTSMNMKKFWLTALILLLCAFVSTWISFFDQRAFIVTEFLAAWAFMNIIAALFAIIWSMGYAHRKLLRKNYE